MYCCRQLLNCGIYQSKGYSTVLFLSRVSALGIISRLDQVFGSQLWPPSGISIFLVRRSNWMRDAHGMAASRLQIGGKSITRLAPSSHLSSTKTVIRLRSLHCPRMQLEKG